MKDLTQSLKDNAKKCVRDRAPHQEIEDGCLYCNLLPHSGISRVKIELGEIPSDYCPHAEPGLIKTPEGVSYTCTFKKSHKQ